MQLMTDYLLVILQYSGASICIHCGCTVHPVKNRVGRVLQHSNSPSSSVLSNLFDTAGHLVNFPPAGGPQSRGPWRARGARAYKGVWGWSLQQGPGAEPLVGGAGG